MELATSGEGGSVGGGAALPFIEGWSLVSTLGEGAFAEVRLLSNAAGECVACKIVNLDLMPDRDSLKKEILIMNRLRHENIIGLLGDRPWGPSNHLIFMEYAAGGELFDRIEPDVGVPQSEAQNFFRQLISGVDYMHSMGICHRDIKPENLLLDENELPWQTAHSSDQGYAAWQECKIVIPPWDRINPVALCSESWCGVGRVESPEPNQVDGILNKRLRSGLNIDCEIKQNTLCMSRGHASQPASPLSRDDLLTCPPTLGRSGSPNHDSFSQPTQPDHMFQLTQSQADATQSSQGVLQRLVKRMTRFFVTVSYAEAIEQICMAYQILGFSWKQNGFQVTASLTDSRRLEIVLKTTVIHFNDTMILADFRLSKGDGLEFKRVFARLRQALKHIISTTIPYDWTHYKPLVIKPPRKTQTENAEQAAAQTLR